MFRPRMNMAVLAAYARPGTRHELRDFRDGPRVVDVLRADALIPAGTRITCTAGHPITTMAESLDRGQRFKTTMLGPFEPFQGLSGPPGERNIAAGIVGQKCGPCLCGRKWSGMGRLHTADGWKPPLPEEAAA